MTMPFAVNERALFDVLSQRGYRPERPAPWGPSGLRLFVWRRVGTVWHKGSVIVTQGEHEAAEWVHASIAFPEVMPGYDDLASLHRAAFGRKRWAYQIFAPESEHVNIHNHALHLWGRADGENALPNFAQEGSI